MGYIIKMTVGGLVVGCLFALFGLKLGDSLHKNSYSETSVVREATVSNDELGQIQEVGAVRTVRCYNSKEAPAGQTLMLVLLFGALIAVPITGIVIILTCPELND